MGKSKAAAAAKQIKKGAGSKDVKKRMKVHFYKPKTLKLAREPKYKNKSVPKVAKMDKYRVIKYPLTTESAMKKKPQQLRRLRMPVWPVRWNR